MNHWFPFERRWRDDLCRAALPSTSDAALPGWDQLDAEALWTRLAEATPAHLQRLWRLTVWMLTLRTLVRRPMPHRFGHLDPSEQDATLSAWCDRPSRVDRPMIALLQLVIGVGYFGDPEARASALEGRPS